MSNRQFPFAVRLIGFPTEEADAFDATFTVEQGKGYGYFRLAEDNLQDPDLYIANAGDLRALATLIDLRPSDLRPALLIGKPEIDLPYPYVARPMHWHQIFEALDYLVERRADALSRLEASDVVAVPERRRRNRLDLDLTDPSQYESMRSKLPDKGAVLVVDKNSAFRDYLAELMARHDLPVVWAGDEAKAIELCRQQSVAVVMINTSIPNVDPYRLCWAVKEKDTDVKTTVIFLVSKPFVYDIQQARYVGADGFLNKPLAGTQVISVLKKFLQFSR
jgi:CheY-like chemotaxis protein